MSGLIPRATIDEVVGYRDQSIEVMAQAAQMMAEAHALAEKAHALAEKAHAGETFVYADRANTPNYRRLFSPIDPQASLATFQAHIDARCWNRLMVLTGMSDLMDAEAKRKFRQELMGDEVPPVTVANARSTLEALVANRHEVFRRGIANAFVGLDRRFKSHDGFKVGSRVILNGLFDGYNLVDHDQVAVLEDIERIFAILDGGRAPRTGSLAGQIRSDRPKFGPQQSVTETDYFKIRVFKNGNAHLWMKRDDLVEKVNLELAAWYGKVMPDGVPDDVTADDIKARCTALRTNLQFYPTPETVADTLVTDLYDGVRVLEPSAGEGAIIEAIAKRAWDRHLKVCVDAIEVEPSRVEALRKQRFPGTHTKVTRANFLRTTPNPIYNRVFMNPPFHGTDWMQHVMHAFEFLAPGGSLHAILPATAEVGTSKAHKAFRKWADQHVRYSHWRGAHFESLPIGSFSGSGTNVNTVILRIHNSRG